jgi:hypothetical protein
MVIPAVSSASRAAAPAETQSVKPASDSDPENKTEAVEPAAAPAPAKDGDDSAPFATAESRSSSSVQSALTTLAAIVRLGGI